MLDAYIIDRIRRERQEQEREGSLIPLHIDAPPELPPEPVKRDQAPERGDRGSADINFEF